jgi:SAM-dependent methyltransferase
LGQEHDWQIDGACVFVVDDDLWTAADALGLCERADQPIRACLLCEPCNILSDCIARVESTLLTHRTNGAPLTCCDVGCGNGRDMVWLAATRLIDSASKWHVVGMDFVAPHLDRIHTFARSYGDDVDARVRTTRSKLLDSGAVRLCDPEVSVRGLSSCVISLCVMVVCSVFQSAPAFDFSQHQYDLVLCVRFLHRSFTAALRRMVAVGGFLMYQTWTGGQPGLSHPIDDRVVLRPDELRSNLFSSAVSAFNKLPDLPRYASEAPVSFDTDSIELQTESWNVPTAAPGHTSKLCDVASVSSHDFQDGIKFEVLINRVDWLPDGRPVQCFVARRVK